MVVKNKRGQVHWIMISLILGIIVLGLVLGYFFQEFFNGEMIDQESCLQSIDLRAMSPEVKIAGGDWVSFKDKFPLKCKTQVFDITEADIVEGTAGKIVADAMVQCWSSYGDGDKNAFPSDWYGRRSTCVPCARIHLAEDAKNYLEKNPDKRIDIESSLRNGIFRGMTYYNYLREVGEAFPALDPASASAFQLDGANFSISYLGYLGTLKNRKTGIVQGSKAFSIIDKPLWFAETKLPKYFNHSQGDLLINYGIYTSSTKGGIGGYFPYLFYFQIDQPSDPFEEVKKDYVFDANKWIPGTWGVSFCEGWEGIPA